MINTNLELNEIKVEIYLYIFSYSIHNLHYLIITIVNETILSKYSVTVAVINKVF